MALTEERPAVERRASARPAGRPRGFRPRSRRRARIAAGLALAAAAIGGNLLVYASVDDSIPVLQVVNDIRAGEQITASDLRTVEVDLDRNVPVVGPDRIGLVLDQYARTHIVSGSLIAPQVLQGTPLVTDGAAIVSVELRPTAVPNGLRERSRVELVVDRADAEPLITPGRVVARPSGEASTTGRVALSVEVAAADAPRIVTAEDIGVVLVDPGVDAAIGASGSSTDMIGGVDG